MIFCGSKWTTFELSLWTVIAAFPLFSISYLAEAIFNPFLVSIYLNVHFSDLGFNKLVSLPVNIFTGLPLMRILFVAFVVLKKFFYYFIGLAAT